MENKFYVYSHYKKTNGECFYIGKGTGNRYKSTSGRNNHWHNIVNKHDFGYIILVNNLSEEKAFDLESNFCKQIGYENLCNIHIENGWGGHTPTEETKIKMYTSERNQNVSNSLRGYKQTEEHVSKRSSHLKGKPNIKNQKPKPLGFGDNIREKLKGKPRPWVEKIILQFDLKGNFIKEWESITKACIDIFNDPSKNPNITRCCQDKIKTAYGFKWKYKL